MSTLLAFLGHRGRLYLRATFFKRGPVRPAGMISRRSFAGTADTSRFRYEGTVVVGAFGASRGSSQPTSRSNSISEAGPGNRLPSS